VARDGTGTIYPNSVIKVKFSILQGSAQGTLLWEEEHTATTNDFGLFNLILGDPAATRTGGSLTGFTDITWSAGNLFLGVKVDLQDGSGYQDLGASRILAVPYALSAKSVGSLKKLNITGPTAQPADSALFEVKRNDGQTVFAVYPQGVRIYVDTSAVKGNRGGFAIGGFGTPAKGISQEYLRVSPDSVRVYVDETVSKGRRGGFAIGGFSPGKGAISDFLHLTPDNYFIGHDAGSSITTGLYNSFFGYDAGVMNTSGNNNVFIGNETGYSNNIGNWNIFIGNTAGWANTTGNANIIMGDEAGYNNTIGSWNVFIGDLAGNANTVGESNVFVGADAGLSNTTGSYNLFMGSAAGLQNTVGASNVFLGESSGLTNSTGESNVFIGTESGYSNDTGNYNVFIGDVAGWSNTFGEDNVFIGSSSGEANQTGSFNVFLGSNSGSSNTFGNYNVFLGEQSGLTNSTGISNVFLGKEAGYSNVNGSYNVFLGTMTGWENTSGQQNVFLGQQAGEGNTTGNFNVAIGTLSGNSNLTGSGNVFIGYQAGINETGSNRLYIDNSGADPPYPLIYGEFDNDYLSFYADVEVAGYVTTNVLWVKSDQKLKKNIAPLSPVTGDIMRLRPVSYFWDKAGNPKGKFPDARQVGLVAQEVEAIFPNLVSTDRQGDKVVNYIGVSVLLLKALQEQNQKNEVLQQQIDQLRKEINALKQM